MSSLSLSTAVHVFPCPNCSETINTSMSQCPFCATAIDHASAETASAETSRISQACSDASYLKIMAWALIPFFFLAFTPFLALAGAAGFWFLKVAIPVMVIRWWVKFAAIKTTDLDYPRARRSAITVGIIWAAVFLLTFPFHWR